MFERDRKVIGKDEVGNGKKLKGKILACRRKREMESYFWGKKRIDKAESGEV